MLYTDLTKTSSVIVNAATEHIVYFGTETADEPGDHGAGGKSILQASEYTGTVHVTFTVNGSPADNPWIRVLTRHEDLSGVFTDYTSTTDVIGDAAGSVTVAIPITGSVPANRNLTIAIQNPNLAYITVSKVQVRLLSQAV